MIKKPKNRIHGKIDPAFKVIIPEHMKNKKAPTTIYAVTMFVKAHSETDALVRIGRQELFGDHIGIRPITPEEFKDYERTE
tara:strand:- start:290 stop:532 length:243 start_codon:yes stop_codon:yes gene_type:complete